MAPDVASYLCGARFPERCQLSTHGASPSQSLGEPLSYIQQVLQPGETIRYQGSVHWIIYWPAIALAVVGVGGDSLRPFGWIAALICFAVALILALRAWFIRWTTEIAVTNLRVIYARGFIQRRSVEVHMDKVESVDVDQSVLGRILDYGTVTIHTTGAVSLRRSRVERPLQLRNQVTAI